MRGSVALSLRCLHRIDGTGTINKAEGLRVLPCARNKPLGFCQSVVYQERLFFFDCFENTLDGRRAEFSKFHVVQVRSNELERFGVSISRGVRQFLPNVWHVVPFDESLEGFY